MDRQELMNEVKNAIRAHNLFILEVAGKPKDATPESLAILPEVGKNLIELIETANKLND